MAARADARWQRLSKARRAGVYRAVGRALRLAREAGDTDVAADGRIAIEVLRAHARGTRTRTRTTRTRATRRAR
ncbi:MAG TPA: hypothetical protein VMZ28_18910 [Kofleriaceae bacterium]|nr:hypothetical protein [Kofleriaceae bacterium]